MMSPLRLVLGSLALALALANCSSCGEQPASAVTFVVQNKLSWPIYVHDELEQLGTVVQRDDNGAWVDMREFAACACEECAEACGRCTCLGEPTVARRIPAGQSATRLWGGEFREEDSTTCSGSSVACVGSRRPVQPGRYRLKVCYASSLATAPQDKDRFPADFPTSALSCAFAEFDHPSTEPVVVSTTEPPGCKATSECQKDQLCQQGRCSSGCLPHEVPALGGEWTLEVGGLDDRGFFTVTTDPVTQARLYTGQGKVSAVRYSAGTTNLTLIRYDAQGLDYTASFYYTLPARRALPLAVGDTLDVTFVDHPSGDRRLARGLTLRQNGALVLAADNGRGGPVLTSQQIAPLEVKVEGEPFACGGSDCGRRTHRRMTFGSGDKSAVVEPGKSGSLTIGGNTLELVSVGNYKDEVSNSDCGTGPVSPYAIILKRDLQQ